MSTHTIMKKSYVNGVFDVQKFTALVAREMNRAAKDGEVEYIPCLLAWTTDALVSRGLASSI
jgi:hypothetical protein